MAFNLKISNEQIEGKDVVPSGQYEVKLLGFKPSTSKSGTSVNLNPSMEIVNNPEFVNRKVYDTLNTGGAFTFPDFAHAFGLPMETDGKESWLPVTFDNLPGFKEDDPKTWSAKSPMIGRHAKVEIVVGNYNGKDLNKINRYFCAVPDCKTKFPKTRHIENLVKK